MLKAFINTNQEYLPKRCAKCKLLGEQLPDLGYYDLVTVHLACHEGADEGHDYSHQGIIVYADNRYSSIPLVSYLEDECGVHYCGTINNRVGIPPEMTKNRSKKSEGDYLERGDFIYKYCDGPDIMMVAWRGTLFMT